jgi:hypothetical protein
MRRAAEKKLSTMKENEGKPDDEKINLRPLTTLDEIVLDILGKGNGSTQRNEFELPEGGQGSFLDPAQLVNICLITEITIRFLTSVSRSPLS